MIRMLSAALLLLGSATIAAPPVMDPLLPLAEHCWEGTFQGADITDLHCY